MSGTAKEAERAQALRHRAAQGDQAAVDELARGENTPHDPGTQPRDPGPEAPPA